MRETGSSFTVLVRCLWAGCVPQPEQTLLRPCIQGALGGVPIGHLQPAATLQRVPVDLSLASSTPYWRLWKSHLYSVPRWTSEDPGTPVDAQVGHNELERGNWVQPQHSSNIWVTDAA